MSDDDKGFKVVDRRLDAEEGDRPASAPAQPSVAEKTKASEPLDGAGELPAIDFVTFILSLGSSAMVHLGQTPHPETRDRRPNLELARQTIDIIAMLQDKTAGNLTGEEERLLASLLTDLRLVYVAASGRK